jgi:Asp/Glu/hydantoin racemase
MEHRTAQAGFSELGTYVLDIDADGHADPWTLQYEESAYVARGRASFLVEGQAEVVATEGEVVALPRGATVRYGGDAGTRIVLSIAPVNWRTQPTEAPPRPTVLFLTPFHFGTPELGERFDEIVETSLNRPSSPVQVLARHVDAFDDAPDGYEAAQTAAVVGAVRAARGTGLDALVVACHYDPAVGEARAAADVPVVAPLQLTAGLAGQFGGRFAVITDVGEAEDVIAGLLDGYGLGEQCVSVQAIGMDGDAILNDTAAAARAVDRLVVELAQRGDVNSVVIGCTIVSAAYEFHRSTFHDHGVVVLDSNAITVQAAGALARPTS